MENPMYACPICRGNLLFQDEAAPPSGRPDQSAIPREFYCPHCEMLVEPVVTSAEQRAEEGIAGRDAGTENHGRSRSGGSNAGGSQRGDLSDEGATQWRTDPRETERNTWEDKP